MSARDIMLIAALLPFTIMGLARLILSIRDRRRR